MQLVVVKLQWCTKACATPESQAHQDTQAAMHFSLFGPSYQQRDMKLFFEQNSHQLGFVAHHIHLCFQARMSDESLLAPHPRL